MLLEICVDTAAGLVTAIENGADRIELCSALALGGLTPTAGFMEMAGDQSVPVRAMIRPREGNFVFSPAECGLMLRNIDAAHLAGLEGVVLGALTADGRLDLPVLARLMDHAKGLNATLHRAVDLLPDPLDAVDAAIELGFQTILTSGGAIKAQDGTDVIAAMQARAAGRIEIMAGSGVNAHNAPAILAATGITALHASCGAAQTGASQRSIELGFEHAGRRDTDAALITGLRAAIGHHF